MKKFIDDAPILDEINDSKRSNFVKVSKKKNQLKGLRNIDDMDIPESNNNINQNNRVINESLPKMELNMSQNKKKNPEERKLNPHRNLQIGILAYFINYLDIPIQIIIWREEII